MTLKDLERILYFENYIVIEPGLTPLKERQLLTEDEYLQRPGRVSARTASPPRSAPRPSARCCAALDLEKIAADLRVEIAASNTGAEAQEARQAPEAGRGVHRVRQQAGVDDPDRRAGDPAGPASARAAGRRPLRDVRPQRPLSPRHQPQQPPEAADRAARAGHHHPQREAHAAGGGRRAVRQRPPRPRHHRRQQASAEVALRHAEGQAGPVPPEPARQARRLFRPFGHRGRSGAEAAPVRPAQEDGARAVQAVHLLAARRQGPLGRPSSRPRSWSRRRSRRSGTSSTR